MKISENVKIKNGSLFVVMAVFGLFGFVFILASLIFTPPVFAAWSASGSCDFAGFTTINASETFPDEASCRDYVARGDGICKEKADAAGYGFLSYTTFTLTQNCTGGDEEPQPAYPEPQPNESSCGGANEYYSNGLCYCNTGYARFNGTCVSVDQWCQATYGANIHGENRKCTCDAGYSFLNGECVTIDQNCRSTYGENAYEKDDSCYCKTGYVFNEKKICVPESKQTTIPSINPQDIQKPPTKDEVARAEIIRALNATKPLNPAAAKIKLKYANEKMFFKRGPDLGDPNMRDPKILEEIRKLYLDAWLADPRNKETNLMMAMLERARGNDSTADVYEKLAYAVLDKPGQSAVSSGLESAQKRAMGDILREKEVIKTWQEQEAKRSSLMNRMKNEFNAEMEYAQETLKEACYKIKTCDQAYAKKVEIMAKAEKLSQKVSDFMDDPLKEAFGFDRKKVKEDLYGKK